MAKLFGVTICLGIVAMFLNVILATVNRDTSRYIPAIFDLLVIRFLLDLRRE